MGIVFYTTNVYFPEEMAKTADDWISMLGLVEHPGDEDGFFSVPFEAASRVVEQGFKEERPASSIAFFLQRWAGPPSAETMFFRCREIFRSTEMLFYHAGEPLVIHILEENSSDLTTKVLGLDIAGGQVPGLAVPGGTWFTRLVQTGDKNSAFSLFSCALAPGFDHRDFKAKKLSELQSGTQETGNKLIDR